MVFTTGSFWLDGVYFVNFTGDVHVFHTCRSGVDPWLMVYYTRNCNDWFRKKIEITCELRAFAFFIFFKILAQFVL